MRGDRAAARGPRDTEKNTAAARVGYVGAGQEGGGGVALVMGFVHVFGGGPRPQCRRATEEGASKKGACVNPARSAISL
jgi:hypothetical protein